MKKERDIRFTLFEEGKGVGGEQNVPPPTPVPTHLICDFSL